MCDLRVNVVYGVCGQPLAGKDYLAQLLAECGCTHISTGDLLRGQMAEAGFGATPQRFEMNEFVAAQRARRGNGYLAELAADQVRTWDVVISGLRHPDEIAVLRDRFGGRFALFAVTAPIETRYERYKARNREGSIVPFAVFRDEELAERDSDSHKVDQVIAMADHTFDNSGTPEQFNMAVTEYLLQVSNCQD